MESTIELFLTSDEAEFLGKLLGSAYYGHGSNVRNSFVEKLEDVRKKFREEAVNESNTRV